MKTQSSSITVAVVAICGAPQLRRCLEALEAQEGAPDFDVVVAYGPDNPDIPALLQRYPQLQTIASHEKNTQYELASLALGVAKGDIILVTEDHCEPRPDWVRQLCHIIKTRDVAAVGGIVEAASDLSSVDWAYYFSDYYRYAKPITPGSSQTLTVCNVAYRGSDLNEIHSVWNNFFNEPLVNSALCERYGLLWLTEEAEVRTHRHVGFADALKERYAFGRLFGATRCDSASSTRRLCYALLAPAAPVLVLARLARKALKGQELLRRFLSSLPALILLVLAWAWGEWLGYITHDRPRSLVVAREKSDQERKIPTPSKGRVVVRGRSN